jgi:hypothetical protein
MEFHTQAAVFPIQQIGEFLLFGYRYTAINTWAKYDGNMDDDRTLDSLRRL